jgi:hypothetical protein
MNGWAIFENHWTGAKVHVKLDTVAAVSQLETGPDAVEIHTSGGATLTVKGTADQVIEQIETATGKKAIKKELETR